MGSKPTGERLATLETKVENIDKRMTTMDANIQEIHDVLLKAKGVRWFVVGAIGLGAMLGAIVTAAVGAATYFRS